MTPRATAPLVVVVASTTMLTGCTLAKDVFKAGMWVGVVAVIAVLLVIGAAMSLMKHA
jgi:hypothetical protein